MLDEAPAAVGSSTGNVRDTIRYHYSAIFSIIFVIYFRTFVLGQFLINFGSVLGTFWHRFGGFEGLGTEVRFHVVFGWPWAGAGIPGTLGLGGDQSGFWALDQQITDG